MKIIAIEPFTLVQPPPDRSQSRRPCYNHTARRAFPIHKYPEFPRAIGRTPGQSFEEVWIRVTAEDGTYGLGNCRWSNLVGPLITQHFAPLLIGRDCFAIEMINDLMWRSTMRFGAGGLGTVVRSALDLALWDLKGKLLEQPVYKLLGGPARESIDVYCTSDDLDWSMELGFKAFKISNPVHHTEGPAGIDIIEEKVAKARETVGPTAQLMYNPVMSFNVEYAIRVMERLRPYRLSWFEEPLMPQDIDGLARIKAAIPTIPLATGEDHQGRHVFFEMARRHCVDIFQPDLRICGGLTEALKIYAIGEAAGIPTIPHAGGNIPYAQHFSFALPEATMAEYWMNSDPGVPLEKATPYPGAAVPVNGKLVPSDAPGFGFEISPSSLAPLPN
ncbi:MAG: enolase C-terminal domain-like protein [Pollutimonas bauzanensis]